MSVSFYLMKDGTILRDEYPVVIDGETFTEDRLHVNMHNAGAKDVANVLGFTIDLARGGAIENLAEFERRCLVTANMLRALPELDSGRGAPVVSGGPGTGQARMIECQRSDGYLARNVEALRKLAERALLEDARLVYA
jgi:hypothetical protein